MVEKIERMTNGEISAVYVETSCIPATGQHVVDALINVITAASTFVKVKWFVVIVRRIISGKIRPLTLL
eukprot:3460970-Amphidinium_carterae.1